jgi:phosphohistidine phosphatase
MLWFLRHGEAVDGRPDESRPLTERGLRQAQAAGVALSRLGIKLDACLASPKRRTVQTAQLACASLDLEVTVEPALAGTEYEAERLALGLGEVLLVGHNPTISGAVRTLSGARVNMRPGGVAGIERGELVVLMTADELSAITIDSVASV